MLLTRFQNVVLCSAKHGRMFLMAFTNKSHFHLDIVVAGGKRPRVLPVTHQVVHEHNKQYFTPYPELTREELEEPPPRVSEEVRELLIASRPRYDGKKFIPAKLFSSVFRKRKRELIRAGHYFPLRPLRDRMLDPMPKIRQHVLDKEERLKRIEYNMSMMPQWINEYKEKRRLKAIEDKKRKEEQRIAFMHIEKLGMHPKDPRAKDILNTHLKKDQPMEKKKKKFSGKKKSMDV